MMTKKKLQEKITSIVRKNNSRAITGDNLQEVLLAMSNFTDFDTAEYVVHSGATEDIEKNLNIHPDLHKAVEIDYVITRGTVKQTGKLRIIVDEDNMTESHIISTNEEGCGVWFIYNPVNNRVKIEVKSDSMYPIGQAVVSFRINYFSKQS